MKITMTAISERQRAHLYIESFFLPNAFIYKKPNTLQKIRQSLVGFIYKNQDTLRYAIFMKILNLTFLYKKYDTLRYVTLLYTNSPTLRKTNKICVTFLYTKIRTLSLRNFYCIFEIS